MLEWSLTFFQSCIICLYINSTTGETLSSAIRQKIKYLRVSVLHHKCQNKLDVRTHWHLGKEIECCDSLIFYTIS